MVRVLIMGRAGANWASRIAEIAGDELELDVARLPAEGIRRFEATPPDLILVIEQSNITRARTLIQAIQNRPLGRLLPIFLLSASPDAAADPEAFARWLEWTMNYTDPVEDSPCPEDTPSG